MALRAISLCAGVGGLDMSDIERRRELSRERNRRWRERNPERARDITRKAVAKWRERNPDAAREGCRDYHARTIEAVRERKRAYYQTVRKAKDATPEGRLRDRNRKAFRRAAHGEGVTFDQWGAILAKHCHACAYCGAAEPLEMDHVEPLSKGGAHSPDNIVPACKPCNSRKGNR